MSDAVCLRLGVVHEGRVLDERLVHRGDVTVGSAPGNTLVLPAQAGVPASVVLVAWPRRGGPRLVPAGRAGRLARNAAPVELASLPAGTEAPLAVQARAKVRFGDVVVLVQCLEAEGAAAAASLKRGRLRARFDWPWLQALVVSAVLLGGSGGGLAAWWDQTGRYFDDLLRVERQSELLGTAEVAVRLPPATRAPAPEPAPATVPATEPPTPTAAPSEVAVATTPAIRVSSPSRAPRGRAARPGQKTAAGVRKKTFLAVLGGPGGTELGGRLTGSAEFKAAFDGTDGGVAVADRDQAAPSLPGPAARPDRPIFAPICEGGACSGPLLPTRPVRTPTKDEAPEAPVIIVRPQRPGPPTGPGIVNPVDIEQVFKRRKGAISHCYERFLQRHPGVTGKVTIRFTLGVAGRITAISTVANSLGDDAVGTCIVDKVRGWRFEPPRGGEVSFVYPFVLETH